MLNKKALVTGGAGFIGSHLCERLLAEGHSVMVLDDLSTGVRSNIQQLSENSCFKFTFGNITDRTLMRALIADCDIVYHLAAAVGVQLILSKPIQSMATNVAGTEVVLELASELKKRVFIASSSEVYGKGRSVRFSEDDDVVLGSTQTTRWSYACSKALDEFLAMAYFRDRGLDVTIARYFNTVGQRQSDQYGMVIPRFVKQAVNGQAITVYGNGEQTRTFNHVLDTVDATYRLSMDSGSIGKVFNVGGQTEISIMDLALKVKAHTGSDSKIHCIPYDRAFNANDFEEMYRRVPDLTRLKQQIGYEPDKTLSDIIDQVESHFRDQQVMA